MTKKMMYVTAISAVLMIIISGAMGAFDLLVQKWVALACIAAILVMAVMPKAKGVFKAYTTPLFVAVVFYLIWNGVSMFYADVPKGALFEFTKLIGAAAVFFGVLFFSKPTKTGFLASCGVISTATAFYGIVSVDAASNGPIAMVFKAFMRLFTNSMDSFGFFENGVRMTGIFGNANTFAGFMALGVLLSLALVMNVENKKTKFASLALLAINALSYILLFSLGSLFMFFLACLIMIALSKGTDKLPLFILMVETALITLVFTGVALLSMGSSPTMPLLALLLNIIVLVVIDTYISSVVIAKVALNSKSSIIAGIAVLILLVGYVAAALSVTGDLTLGASETVMRAAYPDAGEYTIESVSDNTATVRIASQNMTNLKVHTSTDLYNGPLSGAAFTVPEDSEIIKLYFTGSADGSNISAVTCVNRATGEKTVQIKLDYTLLPAIVANRIQDLGANENTVQRMVFFEDGMTLFKQSPIIGHGLSGYETGVASVQNFYYETRYVHNHYIQALCDLGIVGFLLFMGILICSVVPVVWLYRKSKNANYENGSSFALPLLAACLIQIFGQAITDLTWSAGPFLAAAFGILALLVMVTSNNFEMVSMAAPDAAEQMSKGSAQKKKPAATGDLALRLLVIIAALVMTVLLSLNLYAHYRAVSGNCSMAQMANLSKIDRFEGDDYKLSYIVSATTNGLEENLAQADKFATELTHNTDAVLNYLLPYYFNTAQDDKLFETASIAAENGKAAPYMWNRLFEIFNTAMAMERDNPMPVITHIMDNKAYFVDGLLGYYTELQQRNATYLDDAMLDPANIVFIGKILGLEAYDKSQIINILDLFVKTVYTSEFSVDVNTDGLPDNINILSGSMTFGQTSANEKLRFDGSAIADRNTTMELATYCVRGGEYTLRFSGLKGFDGSSAPSDIMAVMNDGTPLAVQYDENGAFITVALKGATEANEANKVEAVPASQEKITVSFPSGMQAAKISLTK